MAVFIMVLSLLTFSLTIYQGYLFLQTKKALKEKYENYMLKNSGICREKIRNYIISKPLPYTFDINAEIICGKGYSIQKENCDLYFCEYVIFFNQEEVERIPKFFLSSYVEGRNIEILRKVAQKLKNYQNSFLDENNHFLDIGLTDGFKDIMNYEVFFVDKKIKPFTDLYSDSISSNIEICTTNCSINENTRPYQMRIRYTSPYNSKTVEILIEE